MTTLTPRLRVIRFAWAQAPTEIAPAPLQGDWLGLGLTLAFPPPTQFSTLVGFRVFLSPPRPLIKGGAFFLSPPAPLSKGELLPHRHSWVKPTPTRARRDGSNDSNTSQLMAWLMHERLRVRSLNGSLNGWSEISYVNGLG